MTHPIPDDALDSDIAILGKKGGGKSYTAKGIVERLLDMERRVLILDPLGVWAGLRTLADGKSPGYPVAIFGGLQADLPLEPAAAEPLADIIAHANLPAVIDLSELSKGAQQAFLLKFLHALRRENHDALTIVLEEADVFAPQNPLGDDSKALHAEIDWIARRGRFRGFRLIAITQRPARLSKDVLTQCATLIVHRLPAPQDRDAVKAWVDGNGDREKGREVDATLAGLDVGEAWVYAPEQNILARARFPRIKTLDTSSTPKAGEKRIAQNTLADVDVSQVRAALASMSSTKQPKNIPQNITADLEAAERRGFDRGRADGLVAGAAAERQRLGQLVLDFAGNFTLETQVAAAVPSMGAPRAIPPAAKPVAKAAPEPADKRPAGDLPPSLQRCIDAIAWWHDIGFADVERTKAAITAGLSPTASTFGVYLGKLKDQGRIEASGPGTIRLTSAGSDLARHAATPDPGDVLRKALALVKAQPARVLQILAETYPEAMSRDDLADRMGLSRTASTLGVYVGECARLGLVTNAGLKLVRAADFLFPSPGAAHDHNN